MRKLIVLVILAAMILPCASAASAELRGTITQWTEGRESALPYATVIIGTDLWLDTSGSSDVVRGKVTAKATSGENGKYVLNAPSGNYSMIIWKAHYIPHSGIGVSVPGTFDGSISKDNQVGSSGRHVGLYYRQ